MRIYDIIDKKRRGLELSQEEIEFFIKGYMDESIADYQASSLLMAICINSMTKEETYYLTKAMIESGDTVDLSEFGSLTVDKHSTGGVGDKTTMIVAPIVASLGCKVAKMSGRGLGFTGGTVDKLESIDGYKSTLSADDFLSQVRSTNISVIGQSGNLTPADKKLYALRDVTATIESIPLIASSIMSKKIAAGSKNIVLDVKYGNGAFMKTAQDAKALALAMIDIGRSFGRNVRALITNMNAPLGHFVGNTLEVYEAISVLSGKGERNLTEICKALATEMVSLGLGVSQVNAQDMVNDAITSGKALKKMKEWIAYQGGDVSVFDSPDKLLSAKHKREIIASKDGYISDLPAINIGLASAALGAGRTKKEDSIDPYAGIELSISYGSYVKAGDVIGYMYSSSKSGFESARELITYSTSEKECEPLTLIYEIL